MSQGASLCHIRVLPEHLKSPYVGARCQSGFLFSEVLTIQVELIGIEVLIGTVVWQGDNFSSTEVLLTYFTQHSVRPESICTQCHHSQMRLAKSHDSELQRIFESVRVRSGTYWSSPLCIYPPLDKQICEFNVAFRWLFLKPASILHEST